MPDDFEFHHPHGSYEGRGTPSERRAHVESLLKDRAPAPAPHQPSERPASEFETVGYYIDPFDSLRITVDRHISRPRLERLTKAGNGRIVFCVDGCMAGNRAAAEAHLDALERADGRRVAFGSAAMEALKKRDGSIPWITVGDDAGAPD